MTCSLQRTPQRIVHSCTVKHRATVGDRMPASGCGVSRAQARVHALASAGCLKYQSLPVQWPTQHMVWLQLHATARCSALVTMNTACDIAHFKRHRFNSIARGCTAQPVAVLPQLTGLAMATGIVSASEEGLCVTRRMSIKMFAQLAMAEFAIDKIADVDTRSLSKNPSMSSDSAFESALNSRE